jgi:UDP-glucose 4-epimerase
MAAVVLVTGGAGFIGSHVVDRLAAAGHRPRILDRRVSAWHDPREVPTVLGDVRRIDDVLRAAAGCSAICHLAAAADVAEVHAQPRWAGELNAVGTLNALEAARRLGLARVIYASTVWVYSELRAAEVDEDDLLPAPGHVYTAGKLAGELYCRSYGELYGVPATILRFGIPYGPRARSAAVVPRFVQAALDGEPLTIAGGGEQERAFVYVEDLAEGVVRALAPVAAGRTYNLAGSDTTTIRGLAELVRDEVAPVAIVHGEGRPGDLRGARVRNDRALAELGWRAQTPLREGVRRYAHWLSEQRQSATDARPAAVAVRRAAGLRRAPRYLAGVMGDPTVAGLVALIAVASAAVSVILGTGDRSHAAHLTVLALSLMLPLWTLAATPWPSEHSRRQAVAAILAGLLSVVVLGLISGDDDAAGDLHGRVLVMIVLFAACLSGLLRTLPRRLAAGSA